MGHLSVPKLSSLFQEGLNCRLFHLSREIIW